MSSERRFELYKQFSKLIVSQMINKDCDAFLLIGEME